MVTKQGTPGGVKNPENLKRVLIVDDEPMMRKLVARHLEGLADVTTAESVEEAEELLQTHQFDVVISDYQMGGKNGLMLLELLHNKHPNVRRILMSGIDVRVHHSARVVDRLAHVFLMKTSFNRAEVLDAMGIADTLHRIPMLRAQS